MTSVLEEIYTYKSFRDVKITEKRLDIERFYLLSCYLYNTWFKQAVL